MRQCGFAAPESGRSAEAGGRSRILNQRKRLYSNDMACPAGFEPATVCLEGRCSIQLSYGHTQSSAKKDIYLKIASDRSMH